MLADGEVERLRELHEDYVWKVNAAIGEGREDLVWRLVDDYTEQALRLMTEEHGPVCGRLDCGICGRRPPRPAPKRRWRRLLRLLAR
jgi:hypothetical protein